MGQDEKYLYEARSKRIIVMQSNICAKIAGLGISLPEQRLSNLDLEKIVDTSDEWITIRTGIKERRVAKKSDTLFELAIPAAVEALDQAKIKSSDLDLIICATSTADMAFPSTACMIQRALKGSTAPAFDIAAACSGFVYGLHIANNLIKARSNKNILLIGSEIMSRIVDWKDRSTSILFGDGAAGVVIKGVSNDQDRNQGIIDSQIFSDGTHYDYLMAGYRSGTYSNSVDPLVDDLYKDAASFLTMKGNQIFKIAIKSMSEVSLKIIEENNFTIDDIDLVVPHQANIRIVQGIGKSLGISDDKIFTNLDKYGNTSAASIPLALYEADRDGRLKQDALVLTVAFGGGFTWGANLIRWN
ncbi:MAG: beta-ketoacyl-ACP synthase III [Nitrospinota bacterium]